MNPHEQKLMGNWIFDTPSAVVGIEMSKEMLFVERI